MIFSVNLLNILYFIAQCDDMVVLFSDFIFHAMPSELQEAVQLGGYVFPDISTLTTLLLQEQALQKLREIAVVSFK